MIVGDKYGPEVDLRRVRQHIDAHEFGEAIALPFDAISRLVEYLGQVYEATGHFAMQALQHPKELRAKDEEITALNRRLEQLRLQLHRTDEELSTLRRAVAELPHTEEEDTEDWWRPLE